MDWTHYAKPHAQFCSSPACGAAGRRDFDGNGVESARHARGSEFVGGRGGDMSEQSKGERMEVEMKIRGLMMDPVTNMPIVVLKDVGSDTVLPIWVGVYEANAIALEIEKA